MKYMCFGSGSTGNCHALIADSEILLLDAGIKYKDVIKGVDYRVLDIIGVCVTHIHKDHSLAVKDFEKNGIEVFKPYDRLEQYRKMGNFEIYPFECKHDVTCYGFYIKHPELGKLIYATDTSYIKYRFRNLNHMIIECNYDEEWLDNSEAKYEHVITGHMELKKTMDCISANYNPKMKNVIFAHLSQDGVDPNKVLAEGQKVAKCDLWIARKGVEIDL